MPNVILPNLGIELPDVGSDQDTWGDILNADLTILDTAVQYDVISKTLSNADVTLTAAEAASAVIRLTGTLTANVNVIVPATPVRLYLVTNGTTGAFSVTVKTAAGTGVAVSQGNNSLVYSDGTNIQFGASSTGAFSASNLSYTGTLTGGTGVVNIGSGQLVKTAGGNLLLGDTSDKSSRAYIQGGQTTTTLLGSAPVLTVRNNASGADVRIQLSDNIANSVDFGLNQGNMYFAIAGAERARITSGGYFKASNTGSYQDSIGSDVSASAFHVFDSDQNNTTLAAFSRSTGSLASAVTTGLRTGAAGNQFTSYLASTIVYRVLANGNVQNTNNSYGAISDAKLKENVVDATAKLNGLNQLRVVNYNLIGDPNKLKQIGLIAQEVEQVFPGLVEETPDLDTKTKEPTGTVTKSIKYSVLVPMLLKGMQEQQSMINAMEARLAALEAK